MFKGVALRILVALQDIRPGDHDEHGQTLAEYGLIISLVAIAAVIVGIIAFRQTLTETFSSVLPCLRGSC